MSIALLIVEHRGRRLEGLRAAISFVAYPIQNLSGLPSRISYNLFGTGLSYGDLLEENRQLKHERLINQSKLLTFSNLEKENIRLRALLENSFKLGEQFLVAELIKVNLDAYSQIILVNKGSQFGVYPKQPVLDAQGIVGQIIRSNPLTSEIMLITDPNHAIPVQINRNGLRTIAVGTGHPNKLSLPFLPNNADIQLGDLLISSGLGEIFPPGYPVGKIDQFIAQPGKPFALVNANPSASLDRSREFLIAWSNREPIPLNKTTMPATDPKPDQQKTMEPSAVNNPQTEQESHE